MGWFYNRLVILVLLGYRNRFGSNSGSCNHTQLASFRSRLGHKSIFDYPIENDEYFFGEIVW